MNALILHIDLYLQGITVILTNIEVSSVNLCWVLCFRKYTYSWIPLRKKVKNTLYIENAGLVWLSEGAMQSVEHFNLG